MTEEEKLLIAEDYKNGLNVKKLEKKYHSSSVKIKQHLLDVGIDIRSVKDNGIKSRKKYPDGWWKSKEHCEEAAKTCRNRREFSNRFSSAWRNSKENGWLNEFSEKYFSDRPEFPSLNSPIHTVYVYEINESHSAYIGRTNGLKRRDNDHRSERLNDIVYRHCNEIGIEIPRPIILEEGLTAIESQKKEDEWREKYQFSGWNILNSAATGEGSSSLGATAIKWTYDTCKIAAEMCKNKEEFKKKYSRAHNVSRENGWINEFFPFDSKKKNGCFDTLEGCKEAAKGFCTIMEIRRDYPFLYQKISKNKWIEEIREYIGEDERARFDDKAKRYGINFFEFNKYEYLPFKKMNKEETDFFALINHPENGRKAIIDKKSILGKYFIVRVDSINTIFTLINVKANGSFVTNQPNNIFSKVTDFCDLHGYRLIQIYDSEFINSYDIVCDKITHFLGIDNALLKGKIYGRNCTVKEISNEDAKEFLDKYHIQGFVNSTVYLGAYYKNEIVAVMSFKNGGVRSEGWELNRFASDPYHTYCGVGGKLFNYFVKKYNPQKVVSYADRRWGILESNMYTKIGFSRRCISNPSYMCFNRFSKKTPKLFHKLNFTKASLRKKYGMEYGFGPEMTEKEMTLKIGYDRIWDCGLIKYIWKSI